MGVAKGVAAPALAAVLLAACGPNAPEALGTLEYDRVTLPAPAAERIVAVEVREGQRVKAGQALLQLDPTRLQADLAAARAQAARQDEVLAEVRAGPRAEDIARARAELAAAQAQARQAQQYYARVRPLASADGDVLAPADLDRARAAAGDAQNRVAAAQAALDALLHGSRPEEIAQASAAAAAAHAQVTAQQVLLDKLHVVAPRDGVIDSLPYKLGDQAPVGAPLAIELVGKAPYARIYVPEPRRASVHDGDAVRVYVGGRDKPYAGHVRLVRDEPVYTPYYALSGEDVARLSYLAEVSLGTDAAGLPSGLPVRVALPEHK